MDINLQGVCFDAKSSFMRGPAQAPPLIREYLYSESTNSYSESGVDISTINIIDKGDFEVEDYQEIENITLTNLSDDGVLVTLGGDHSITYPIVKAHQSVFGDFDILHIDAHGDLYHEFEGDKFSHACPFARIMEGKHAKRLVQIGIRALTSHQRDQVRKYGVEVTEMKDYNDAERPEFNRPIYLSLDMDAFDPAFAPGVSHHEPGGLTSRQVIDLILNLDTTIIGADIVEYNPKRDVQGVTGALAAKMLKEIIASIAS